MATRDTDGRAAAQLMVVDAVSQRGWNSATLARAAQVDPATAADFLNGVRWPTLRTLARIDAALGWEPGTLARVAVGKPALNMAAVRRWWDSEHGDVGAQREEGSTAAVRPDSSWSVDLTDLEGPDLTPLERKLIEQASFLAAADKLSSILTSRTHQPITRPEEAGTTGPRRERPEDDTAIAEATRELADDLEGERAVLARIEAELARLKASTQAAQDRPDAGAGRGETGGHRSGPENTARVEQ